jgi:superfamily II DNA or RNA helicase
VNRQRREQAKKKRRERANRSARSRRIERERSRTLIYEADAVMSISRDRETACRLLEKALRIHPTSPDAHERLAELYIGAGLLAEGLAHFQRLTRAPEWPHVTYLAAAAAYQLGRFDEAGTLAQMFLRASRLAVRGTYRGVDVSAAREHARRIASTARALVRRAGPSGGASRGQRGAASRPSQPTLDLESAGVGDPRGIEAPHALPAAPQPSGDERLPPFPALDLPELTLQLEAEAWPRAADGDVRPAAAADPLLRREYAELRLQRGFDQLLSLSATQGVERFWYQLETVRRVLRDFRGRVLLADEVGLGKTIEACLALKEYWMRGLVSKALILTPPSLVSQWIDELGSKFGLPAAAAEPGKAAADDALWDREAIVVASLPLVRQRAYRSRLTTIEYDLVIVDEAHALKNRTSAAWQLVNELNTRFLLLLSATPVGNDLTELYNLILLLKPGLLKTDAQFRRDFGGLAALQAPERRDRLRALLREVMIRNTRAHIDVRLPRRLAATEVVAPTPAEDVVHERLSSYIHARYENAGGADRWRLLTLQMQAGSSPAALAAALDRAGDADADLDALRAAVACVRAPAKTHALTALLGRSREQTIVFTRFRATLDHLREALEATGLGVACIHGGLTAAEKDVAIERFAAGADVLVSTEVGGLGRNLQFCRTVVNYDLPWNPVQLEQRVGRVHRIGQSREVFVFNFCLRGSLEEYILTVLHDKLNLFELVAGEIEMILGELDADRAFADVVMELWARSATPGERDSAFERLASELLAAKERYQRTQEIDRAVFREDFEV